MKNHVRAFIDEGNDVSSMAHGGVPRARVSLIEVSFPDKLTVKLPGISKHNFNKHNFEFQGEGVRVWRAYSVGEGKLFLWSNFKCT